MTNIKLKDLDGREKETYDVSNAGLLAIVNGETESTDEERSEAQRLINDRFKFRLCPKNGEGNDEVFARFFSDFVNNTLHNEKNAAMAMAHDHRYLQQEMFKVFLEYAKLLRHNFNNDVYDGRNEYACKCAKIMLDALDDKNFPY